MELEKAIQEWKRELRQNPSFEDGDIAELESHLREQVERLTVEGLTEEEAFHRAASEIGNPDSIGDEMYKTRTTGVDASPPWKQSSWMPALLPNYIKIALRNFRRHPVYSSINVFGLAVGLACCLLIFLFVQLEISYDRFHAKSDRIYRVVTDITQGGQTRELAWSSPPLAQALVADLPEVEQAVRIHRPAGTVQRGEESEVVEVSFVDNSFFSVFDFKLSNGDRETALSRPGSVIITPEQADRFFKGEDPMQKTITFADTLDLEVTGILAEIPPNSHFQPQFIAAIETLPDTRFSNWGGMNLWTYIVVNPQAGADRVEEKLPGLIESRLGKAWKELMTLRLQPLTSIYFESDRLPEIGPTGDRSYVYIFTGIGIFVLIIACINFMNLATAQSFQRAKEVGIRKVLGVYRGQLIRQFLGESVLLTFVAVLLAIVMAQMALPVFEDLSGYELPVQVLLDPVMMGGLIGIAILVGIASGSYPAFVLSLFKPSAVLSGNLSLKDANVKIQSSNNLLRRALVTFQFVITIFLLIGTGIIINQLDFIRDKKLGFDKEQVVVVRLSDGLRGNYDPLKQGLLQHSNILQAGASSQVPGVPVGPRGYRPEGMDEGELLTNTLWVDAHYLDMMNIELEAGRGLSPERPSDLNNGIILNEAAVGHFGWPNANEALGKSMTIVGQNPVEGRVIGIVKNFNYESLHNEVAPLVIRFREQQQFLSLRISGDRITDTMDFIEEQWASVVPDEPLVSWFLDDQLQNLYEAETRMADLFSYFSGLAILLACLGLFGIASYSIQRRTKEIGIRKVLGASVTRITYLLSREYTILVLAANLVAWPAAYIAMNRWLNNFAYQVTISPWIFAAAGGAVVFVALATVSYHSIRAANMNPVQSLKSE